MSRFVIKRFLSTKIRKMEDNWELLSKELKGLIEEIKKGRLAEEIFDFNPKSEMPFLGLIKK